MDSLLTKYKPTLEMSKYTRQLLKRRTMGPFGEWSGIPSAPCENKTWTCIHECHFSARRSECSSLNIPFPLLPPENLWSRSECINGGKLPKTFFFLKPLKPEFYFNWIIYLNTRTQITFLALSKTFYFAGLEKKYSCLEGRVTMRKAWESALTLSHALRAEKVCEILHFDKYGGT